MGIDMARMLFAGMPDAPEPGAIAETANALRRGALVILPTDTVYGIAADPRRAGWEHRLRQAKHRPENKPIPFLASSLKQIEEQGAVLNAWERALADAFWPGGLTLVLQMSKGREEGFRVPNCAVTLAVLNAVGTALRVTSANLSSEPAAKDAAAALAALGKTAEVCLDAGLAPGGIASSVVRIRNGHLDILRAGAIPDAALENCVRNIR